MAKISEIKIKCPCPIHQGKRISVTAFGIGGNSGRQGYCKEYRNQVERERYQEKKKALRKKQVKRAGNRPSTLKKAMKPIPPPQLLTPINPSTPIKCKKCGEEKSGDPRYWQSNGRGGYRQPCKECLKNIRTSRKES